MARVLASETTKILKVSGLPSLLKGVPKPCPSQSAQPESTPNTIVQREICGKFGRNFAGFFRTHKIKAQKQSGKNSEHISWEKCQGCVNHEVHIVNWNSRISGGWKCLSLSGSLWRSKLWGPALKTENFSERNDCCSKTQIWIYWNALLLVCLGFLSSGWFQ